MGRRTSQYSLHFSMVRLTFFMLNSTFYMVNTTFHMANYSLFIWSTRLFIWSTNHFLYGQLITFYMVNTTSLWSTIECLVMTTTMHCACAQTQTKGAYHWTKNSGVNFQKFPWANVHTFSSAENDNCFSAWNFSMTSRFKSQRLKQTEHW